MLFMRPSQVSWILGVTQGYTDADTRKRVGADIPYRILDSVLSSTYCAHQLVGP
jgi:hypothetical protein